MGEKEEKYEQQKRETLWDIIEVYLFESKQNEKIKRKATQTFEKQEYRQEKEEIRQTNRKVTHQDSSQKYIGLKVNRISKTKSKTTEILEKTRIKERKRKENKKTVIHKRKGVFKGNTSYQQLNSNYNLHSLKGVNGMSRRLQ